jgi:hypothetical protein
VCIWCASQGDAKYADLAAQAGGAAATQAASAEVAVALREQALAARDRAHRALLAIAGKNGDLERRADAAYGSAAASGDALVNMATLGRGWLAKPTPAMKTRLRGARITSAWLDELAALGAQVKTAERVGGAPRRTTTVSQGDVDAWDGRNLELLRDLIHAFDAGHATDPKIPRLVPISLRNLFGRRRPAKAAPPAPTEGARPTDSNTNP